jgi:hypothetical protein
MSSVTSETNHTQAQTQTMLDRMKTVAPLMSPVLFEELCTLLKPSDNHTDANAMCALIETMTMTTSRPRVTTNSSSGKISDAAEPGASVLVSVNLCMLPHYIKSFGLKCCTATFLDKVAQAMQAGVSLQSIILSGSCFLTVHNDNRLNLEHCDFDQADNISAFRRCTTETAEKMFVDGMGLMLDKVISNTQNVGVKLAFLDMETVYNDHLSSIMTAVSTGNSDHAHCAACVRQNIIENDCRFASLVGTLHI